MPRSASSRRGTWRWAGEQLLPVALRRLLLRRPDIRRRLCDGQPVQLPLLGEPRLPSVPDAAGHEADRDRLPCLGCGRRLRRTGDGNDRRRRHGSGEIDRTGGCAGLDHRQRSPGTAGPGASDDRRVSIPMRIKAAMGVSILILTLNEERNIAACLEISEVERRYRRAQLVQHGPDHQNRQKLRRARHSAQVRQLVLASELGVEGDPLQEPVGLLLPMRMK